MNYQLLDIIVVSSIVIFAMTVLVYFVFKMLKKDCASLCGDCSVKCCSSKNFSNNKNIIKFHSSSSKSLSD